MTRKKKGDISGKLQSLAVGQDEIFVTKMNSLRQGAWREQKPTEANPKGKQFKIHIIEESEVVARVTRTK